MRFAGSRRDAHRGSPLPCWISDDHARPTEEEQPDAHEHERHDGEHHAGHGHVTAAHEEAAGEQHLLRRSEDHEPHEVPVVEQRREEDGDDLDAGAQGGEDEHDDP